MDHRDWDALGDLLDEQVSFLTPEELANPWFDPANYLRSRDEIKAAYPRLRRGALTQHLIAGHQVGVDGDRTVCRAHSINVDVVEDGAGPVVAHGNEYRFELR